MSDTDMLYVAGLENKVAELEMGLKAAEDMKCLFVAAVAALSAVRSESRCYHCKHFSFDDCDCHCAYECYNGSKFAWEHMRAASDLLEIRNPDAM